MMCRPLSCGIRQRHGLGAQKPGLRPLRQGFPGIHMLLTALLMSTSPNTIRCPADNPGVVPVTGRWPSHSSTAPAGMPTAQCPYQQATDQNDGARDHPGIA